MSKSPKSPASDSPRSPEAWGWGEVRARGQTVHYRRSGAGRALVLLHSPADSEALWPELLEMLNASFRVVVPDPPAPGADVEAWLSVLLEGLGILDVTAVASDDFCVAALERALVEPEQVARVILVCQRPASDGAIDSTPRFGSVPLLVLRRDRPAAEVLPLVASFLESGGAASA